MILKKIYWKAFIRLSKRFLHKYFVDKVELNEVHNTVFMLVSIEFNACIN